MVKFSEQICEELCILREEGLPQTSCADLVGINRRTLYNWLEAGKKAKSGKKRDFYLKWIRASAKYERKHLNEIGDSTSWLAHQYLLQVKDPDTYVVAEKQQIEANVDADNTIKADVDVSSDEFLQRELDLMKAIIRDKKEDTDEHNR